MSPDLAQTNYLKARGVISSKRAILNSYDKAYRVALLLTDETQDDHLVVATGNPLQPHAVVRSSDVMPGGRLHEVVQIGWIVAHVQAAA